ncbi:amino-acid N-acetyltransferase [Actinomyces viscosus]|uniref:Amino-acid acetyltransferase n=1 Tax=Actinomyces viscosus TaxID=1656 RepID=A0A3S4ZAK2_ACTVI|nr:amino-acid N-acetyltransferase [Actinomyces viscosus]TFH53370.1 amino-acid N-acetyltransferase [Actinomyces viscosus]VEI18658.1 Amino-acid acetyltransferase [Actinomyces viscosus]
MSSTAVTPDEQRPAGRVTHRVEVYGVDGARRVLRPARPADVRAIAELVRPYAERRVLISKDLISYFEDIQEFIVAEEVPGAGTDDGQTPAAPRIVGCGALHVMWDDIAEVRTLAVHPDALGTGLGSAILRELIAQAREMGLKRVFCLTFEEPFFGAHGFEPIEGTPVGADVFSEMLRSHDDGLAEFLDLARVKPNTLGNARMLLQL